MNVKKPYTINDFKIGESVVPMDMKELTLVIIDIDKKRKRIICRLSTDVERLVNDFAPEELEKEFVVRPPNIIYLPKPKKDDAKETAEE